MTQFDLPPRRKQHRVLVFIGIMAAVAVASALIAALLVNIWHRKEEARNPYLKFVQVDENTTDPAVWGANWPREYNSYLRTVDATHTRYGGSEAMTSQKLERDPWLKAMFSGYAFSIDYRDRRGHAYMLSDQVQTERITKRPQPGACLHCHASAVPTWRRVGINALAGRPATGPSAPAVEMAADDFNWPAVMKGFEIISALPYADAYNELLRTPDGSSERMVPPGWETVAVTTQPATQPSHAEVVVKMGEAHPVSCVDCHHPRNMELRVTRPGFVRGIQALANSDDPVPHLPSVMRWRQGSKKQPYDPNVDASRQEMRSFVCAQCHVEYYCGPKTTLFFPWHKGLKIEQIEATYDVTKFPDGTPFMDWKHGITGAPVYKAQHPEFEMWSQGVHARAGVACADCHMPYQREGAIKVSDHWVRSPLLQVNRACQTCHPYPEQDLIERVNTIQNRTRHGIERAAAAVSDMIEAIRLAKVGGSTDGQLKPAYDLQRSSQWRLDYVYAENSMGFHASQETMRILADSIDMARRAQLHAESLRLRPVEKVTTVPVAPVEGVTPTEMAPLPNPRQ